MAIEIRPFKPIDAWRLTDIFYDSVHSIESRYYSLAEVNAWAPLPVDYAHWRERLLAHQVFVAELDGEVVGFTAMEPDGYIDWIYTHSHYQRRGVATALYRHLEELARQSGITRLHVDASHLARPFFERQGFRVLSANQVSRHGVVLENWKMEKALV